MLRNLARAAAAATMLTTLAAAAAEASGRVIVFGDSLSDNGNTSATTGNPPGPPYYRGSNGFTRFSNGPVWVEQLFGNFNSPVQGSGVNGNVDLAFGGALAGTGTNANGPIPNVQQQIGIYLASGGRIGAGDLVVVWAGANDIFQTTATTAAGFVTAGATAATSELNNVQSLISLGAQRLLVPNLPDFGQLPAFNTSAATSAAGTLSSSSYNATLDQGLHSLAAANRNVNIIQMDIAAMARVIFANPTAFGLTNITQACFTGTTVCATPNSFALWDSVHPSATVQALEARYAGLLLDTSPAAASTGALGGASIASAFQVANASFDRLQSWVTGQYAQQNGIYAEALAAHGTQGSRGIQSGYNYGSYGVRSGIDRKFGNFLVGGSATFLEGNVSGDALKFGTSSQNIDVYASALLGSFFANVDIGASRHGMDDIRRDTGFPTVIAKGDTSGHSFRAAGELGYAAKVGAVTLMPSARLTYIRMNVGGYSETAPLLALSYVDREIDLLLGAVRLRASMPVNLGASPTTIYSEIAYENFFRYNQDKVVAQLIGNTALPTAVDLENQSAPGLSFKLGLNAKVSQSVTVDLQYGIALQNGDGVTHSGMARVKIPF